MRTSSAILALVLALSLAIVPAAQAQAVSSQASDGPPADVRCPDTSKCCVYVLGDQIYCQDFEAVIRGSGVGFGPAS